MMNKAKLRRQAAKIMIVDDEEIVTRSIANLIQLETDYHLLTFQSPKEALRAMQSEPIDCIITDFLMPEMDGLAFLKKANSIDPEMPKILLTGYADKENAIRAINEANIFQYLEKPWDNDNLKLVIRNAVNQRSMQQSLTERLRELDRTIVDRDSFRHTAQQLESELELAQEVTAAAAGGPHPIIFSRSADQPVRQWVLNGLPLGAFDAELYQPPDCQKLTIAPGDRILLYTDGLLDIDIESGESKPPEEIVKCLGQIRRLDGDDLLDRLADVCGINKKTLPDDINILLIDRR